MRRSRPSDAIERFHQQLAVSAPNLHVTAVDDDTVEARLRLAVPRDPPGRTEIWLASLPRGAHGQELGESLDLDGSRLAMSPRSSRSRPSGRRHVAGTRRCVIKAALTGAVDGRRQDAVFSILRSKQDVLRYLVFLLGDPSYDALFAQLAGVELRAAPGTP